jgi:hypothetical protein
MKPILMSLCFAAALSGCGSPTGPTTWVQHNLTGIVRFAPAAPSDTAERAHTFWRGDGVTMSAVDSAGIAALRSKIQDGSLVMVSFKPDSETGRYLTEAPSTWAYYKNEAEGTGYGLVYVRDMFTLDGLAALAHRDSGCGAIELLSLNLTQNGASEQTPPVYPEFVALAPVSTGMQNISAAGITASIKKLEAQGTRHHATDTGLATSDLVASMFTDAASGISGFKTEQISHENAGASVETAQKSVIATIPGTSDDQTTVVIGAHLDSINQFGVTQNAPGADDDASGIATLTEVIRAVAASGWTFRRRIEFHAYAAEEVGLIGSSHIAQTYAEQGRRIAAMLQVDMNSWSTDPGSQKIHLVDQFTSATLNRSLKDLLNTYLGGDFAVKSLAGGTSDHKSWHLNGYAAVFPFEDPAAYNKALHSTNDTSTTINNIAMSARFAKMIVAFLAHYAGLNQASGPDGYASFKSSAVKDLFLAVTPGTGEGFYNIAVSAPAGVESVEVCFTGSAGSAGCIKEKTFTTRSTDLNDRRIFTVDGETAISEDNRIAVFGYDTADKITALRTARLNKQ